MIAGEMRVFFAIISVVPATHGITSARPSAVFELAQKRSKVATTTTMAPNARFVVTGRERGGRRHSNDAIRCCARQFSCLSPQPTRKNALNIQLWGPSGASIWSSPSVDPNRHTIYGTTGDNYSDPPADTSDAFLAFGMKTGELVWSHQMTAGDAFTAACDASDQTNCPEARGPDFDFCVVAATATFCGEPFGFLYRFRKAFL
jgi:glucose dehydrogenase